jgi:D-3-phosphoglycerate dehydrogenase
MNHPKILVTCPPMLGLKEQFIPVLEGAGFEAICPNVTQTLSEEKLIELVPECDGWIIGDDPATRRVFEAGAQGKLRAAVKWGIGVDNVDFEACKDLGIPITNTPGMFGAEVADVALGYLLSLARYLHVIDRGVRDGAWPKNRGMSLSGKTVGVIGYGDIGQNTVSRCQAFGLNTIVYDPGINEVDDKSRLYPWPSNATNCDFLIFTCSLNDKNVHMLNSDVLTECKKGVRIINVARGPLINEDHLIQALKNGKVHSVALDVFETEPLPISNYFREHNLCILGTHNSSNTTEAVSKTNIKAINLLLDFLFKDKNV